MVTRRAMKGVLGNFLGTYVSRYSDDRGILLFEPLVRDHEYVHINLLAPTIEESVLGTAVQMAAYCFADQMKKARFSPALVKEAWLTIRRGPEPITGQIYGRTYRGYAVDFEVVAIMDNGKRYQKATAEFIATNYRESEPGASTKASNFAMLARWLNWLLRG